MNTKSTDQRLSPKYLVWVRCFTYNQSQYIVDALDGFCKQVTDFPFVCTIVDDASTDGEQAVIRKYLIDNFEMEDNAVVRNEKTEQYQRIFARHRYNHNCYFSVLFLQENHYSIKKSKWPYLVEWAENSEYHALCEGDDYWTDSNKLQRQVEYLICHPECSAISENALVLDVDSGEEQPFRNDNEHYLSVDDLALKQRVPTASLMYRASALDKMYYSVKRTFDRTLFCFLASNGYFYYNAIISSIYRKGSGVTAKVDPLLFAKKEKDWHLELLSLFPQYIEKNEVKRKIILLFIVAANRYIKQNIITYKILLCYKEGFMVCPRIFVNQMVKQYIQAIRRKLANR